jgi:hypothetical protein
MTREEFIKVLEEEGYSYKLEGDKIVVTYVGNVDLESLESLPPDVEFKNEGWVDLYSLKSLPLGVVFQNEGWVDLESLTSLPPGLEFNNKGDVNLDALIGGGFNDWEGNIEGIESNSLLNLMIKRGMFI